MEQFLNWDSICLTWFTCCGQTCWSQFPYRCCAKSNSGSAWICVRNLLCIKFLLKYIGVTFHNGYFCGNFTRLVCALFPVIVCTVQESIVLGLMSKILMPALSPLEDKITQFNWCTVMGFPSVLIKKYELWVHPSWSHLGVSILHIHKFL